jgi:hypothetical protein
MMRVVLSRAWAGKTILFEASRTRKIIIGNRNKSGGGFS